MSNNLATNDAIDTWKHAHRLVLDLYQLTSKLPSAEQVGLTPKVRTSAVKVASNIVEGYARKSDAHYLQHLSDALVALEETKYSLLVIRDLGYISEQQYDAIMGQAEDISERIGTLQTKLSVNQSVAPPESSDLADDKYFGTKKSFSDTAKELWSWVKGGTTDRLKRDEEPRVWTEDPPLPNYLEESIDFKPQPNPRQFDHTPK